MPLKRYVSIGVLAIASFPVFSQHVFLSSDSSEVLYPNNVSVKVTPETDRFILSPMSLQVLLAQSNYLYERLEVTSEMLNLLKSEFRIRDSVAQVMKQTGAVSDLRLHNYADAYAKSMAISNARDKQLQSLLDDVSKLERANRKGKRKSFIRGLGCGIAAGAFATLLLFFLAK